MDIPPTGVDPSSTVQLMGSEPVYNNVLTDMSDPMTSSGAGERCGHSKHSAGYPYQYF